MDSYEEVHMIKTFRGLMSDGAQDTIVLRTNDGSVGYRIVKFESFPKLPGTADYENTLQIFKVEQSSVSTSTANVDFSNQELLAALYYSESASTSYTDSHSVVFDREIFNQDIYITHTDTNGSEQMNYYLELEQVKLDLNESTVATLKDIRNQKRIAPG